MTASTCVFGPCLLFTTPVLIAGAEALGAAFMLYFFVTIGAAAGSLSALAGCGWIALFIAVQLSTHLVITLGVGHLTSLPLQVCFTLFL